MKCCPISTFQIHPKVAMGSHLRARLSCFRFVISHLVPEGTYKMKRPDYPEYPIQPIHPWEN